MYSYKYDEATGGILLNSSPLILSNEPRPVYYKELDILGFDKYWNYEKNDTYPYMWAEANNYFYRGRKVAQTKGGSCYTAPEVVILEEPEPNGQPLRFVDVLKMVEMNSELLEGLVQDTIKKVYNTYRAYSKKVDVFYVAFSGGKDSIVTFDIVQRALPHSEFMVLFGDTGMEFPDTYSVVDKIEKQCESKKISFIRAKSIYSPKYTWTKFGPPSKTSRWCCSVHKTAPQILSLREYTGKTNFTGMAFIGIRANESAVRNEYDYVSLGEKHKGQYSCNPILEWNSAELYSYIFSENLIINDAYKKGNNRAGCLVCPNVSEKNAYFRIVNYETEVNIFMNLIKDMYKDSISSIEQMEDFLEHTGWKARMNGRDLSVKISCSETSANDEQIIKVRNPKTDWKEWIKTVGILINDTSPYRIIYNQGGKQEEYEFEITELSTGGYDVHISDSLCKSAPQFTKLLKNVFHKAGCCICCKECEADCHNGYIKMEDGKVSISDMCNHCSQCHKVERGCLIYKSLELPKGGSKMENKSLNCYSTHAPKIGWINQYFTYKNDFATNNDLGSQMISFFKRFLRDSGLMVGDSFSETAQIIENIGLDENTSWGIMLANLAYSPQINWFVKNIPFNELMLKDYIISLIVNTGANERAAGDIFRSLNRFSDLPFSEVGIGNTAKEKNRATGITRTPWQNPDPRVILYSLFKFAEACGYYDGEEKDENLVIYNQFTLSRLLNNDIESNGVSPTQIFGIGCEQMEKILTGLSINYTEFINVSFTHDLDNITLRIDKRSKDVLNLF